MQHRTTAKKQTTQYRITATVMRYCIILLFTAGINTGCTYKPQETRYRTQITLLDGFPDSEPGIEQGVSAAYTGIHNGTLYMAGGCNFPEIPAAEGGAKRYYKGIYTADITEAETTRLKWEKTGEIPEASAYGVALSTPEGIICIGGTGYNGALKSAYIIRYDATTRTTVTEPLPDMPYAIDNMGGAYSNKTIYISGGNADSHPSRKTIYLNLDSLENGWRELPQFPGKARLQPVCAIFKTREETELDIWGGYAPPTETDSATLDAGGYTFSIAEQKWKSLPPPAIQDKKQLLSGATAVQKNDTQAIFYGGIDEKIFKKALDRESNLARAIQENDQKQTETLRNEKKEYMTRPATWYNFNKKMLLYDNPTKTWHEIAVSPHFALAGSSSAITGDTLYIIGGEIKPGVRIPRIIRAVIQQSRTRQQSGTN